MLRLVGTPSLLSGTQPTLFVHLQSTDGRSPLANRRHWLVINIPGCQVDKGDALTPYMGPAPPAGTGHHRYVFVLYKQSGTLNKERLNKYACPPSSAQ